MKWSSLYEYDTTVWFQKGQDEGKQILNLSDFDTIPSPKGSNIFMVKAPLNV